MRELGPKATQYGQTARDTLKILGLKIATQAACQAAGIPVGNEAFRPGQLRRMATENPGQFLFKVGIKGPIREEVIFRVIPSLLCGGKENGARWDVGTVSAALFALRHCFQKQESGEFKFVPTLPITQFIGGLHRWYLARTKGETHAVFAHMLENSLLTAIYIAANSLTEKLPNHTTTDDTVLNIKP